jgi:hypothetical protein
VINGSDARACLDTESEDDHEMITIRKMIAGEKSCLALLGLTVAAGLAFMPATAQASTSAPAKAGAATGFRRATAEQCAAVRAHLKRSALNCADLVTAYVPAGRTVTLPAAATPGRASRVTGDTGTAPTAAASSGTYTEGYLEACSTQSCTGSWYAQDEYNVTYIHNVGVWDNHHVCSSGGTPVTWCGTWHNGYSNYMEEGFNFGNNGYLRLEIDTYGNITFGSRSSYAWVFAFIGDTGEYITAPPY